ncbi:hypothetical protein I4F81_000462 [Pyropia yezoensis]|uniref:Uncharacterized protein n=1 Tax=Pyropia yezoensis TaxID=2788 RepID=A0ACC3BJQ9_PYRYE|nr:hypothetical protein I4F81_000462 [Neopyropia yezoensis]
MDAWEFNVNAYKAFEVASLVFGPLCRKGDVTDLGGELNEQDIQARPRYRVIDLGGPAITPSTVLVGLPAVGKLMDCLFRRFGPANPEDMQYVQLGDVYCRSDLTSTAVGKDVGGGNVTVVLPGNVFYCIRDEATVFRLGPSANPTAVMRAAEEFVLSPFRCFASRAS